MKHINDERLVTLYNEHIVERVPHDHIDQDTRFLTLKGLITSLRGRVVY
jgi:hypothetical protein